VAPEADDAPPPVAAVQVKFVPPKLSETPFPVTCPELSWTKL
jgi:hypothetical protein